MERKGSDFSLGPMKLRRTYLVANEEYKDVSGKRPGELFSTALQGAESLKNRFKQFFVSSDAAYFYQPSTRSVRGGIFGFHMHLPRPLAWASLAQAES